MITSAGLQRNNTAALVGELCGQTWVCVLQKQTQAAAEKPTQRVNVLALENNEGNAKVWGAQEQRFAQIHHLCAIVFAENTAQKRLISFPVNQK